MARVTLQDLENLPIMEPYSSVFLQLTRENGKYEYTDQYTFRHAINAMWDQDIMMQRRHYMDGIRSISHAAEWNDTGREWHIDVECGENYMDLAKCLAHHIVYEQGMAINDDMLREHINYTINSAEFFYRVREGHNMIAVQNRVPAHYVDLIFSHAIKYAISSIRTAPQFARQFFLALDFRYCFEGIEGIEQKYDDMYNGPALIGLSGQLATWRSGRIESIVRGFVSFKRNKDRDSYVMYKRMGMFK